MHRPMAASPGSKPRPFGLESGWTGISDPTLAWDKGGNLWLPGLAFAPGLNGALIGIAMYSSGDGGKTWSPPNLVHTRSGDGKQWAVSDTHSSSPDYGNVYVAWDDLNAGVCTIT